MTSDGHGNDGARDGGTPAMPLQEAPSEGTAEAGGPPLPATDGRAAMRASVRSVAWAPGQEAWRTEALRSHAEPRLLLFTRGQGRINAAGLTAGYGPNNLVYLPAHTLYAYEAQPALLGQMAVVPGALGAEWPDVPIHLRLRDVHVQREIAFQIDALDTESSRGDEVSDHAARCHLGLLSVLLRRQVAGAEGDARAAGSQARLVRRFAGAVARGFRSPRGVGGYAADLGVTATHLTRCCRATAGLPATVVLAERKFYEARALLRDTRLPVGRIGSGLGFGSAAYFTRAFQARTGMSPSAFRELGPVGLIDA
ncbi:MAG: helix-turn-helix domain-containing protein [Paracoccaceae bacterium]